MNCLTTALLPALVASCTLSARAVDQPLYQTDFSLFAAGEDQLVGTDGWSGTNVGEGVHGIDEDAVANQGKTAYLGGNLPGAETSIVSLSQELDEPATGRIRFQTVLGITESFEGGTDLFAFSFFNSEGEYLSGIQFDTSFIDFGVWTDDGIESQHTGEEFLPDFLHRLNVVMDIQENVWSADLDGIPLFDGLVLNATGASRNLASMTVDWEILETSSPGDNWLLFDDISLEAIDRIQAVPADAIWISRSINTSMMLEWQAAADSTYQIEYSEDGRTWKQDLPNSLIESSESELYLHYVDDTASAADRRLYRILTLVPTT